MVLETQRGKGALPSEVVAPVSDSGQQPRDVLNSVQTWHNGHGIEWHGFGEVNYKVLDQRRPELGTFGFEAGSAGNFYTGDFELLLHLTDQ